MKIVSPSVRLEHGLAPMGDEALQILEKIGRTSYKSEDTITEDSAREFVKLIILKGHLSILEHLSYTLRFICDRGISHEIVRHRIGAYTQESTRFCDYSRGRFESEITVINPGLSGAAGDVWFDQCAASEDAYLRLTKDFRHHPQTARSILPTCLKTEIVVTYNLRQWRHFFEMRCSSAAHPQIKMLAGEALVLLNGIIPIVFEDQYKEYVVGN